MTSTDAHPEVPADRSAGRGQLVAEGLGARWRRARDSKIGRWVRRVGARLLDRYPALPPAPGEPWQRIGLALTALLALAFTLFFSAYLFAQQDAYLTHAEDLGIMDQALWSTLHGAPLHQTICNIVSDTNCIGDVSRLAIHFEPIMFVISLLYLVAPSPKTLQLFQALVVACGTFPAYWLASRRLQSVVAGVAFAAIYLLYPALQAAVTYDFHAVTLAAAFLMFALYFMLSRNDVGLYVACLLALSTKEEIPLAVTLIGLSVALLQRRWRVGFGLVGMALAWLAVELAVMHLASPLGHSPTASRYAQLGGSPIEAAVYVLTHPLAIMRDYVLEPSHRDYLRSLLSPAAYLPILSPLTLLIAVPALAINLFSSDPAMYSGIYHYNAEIVPVLVLATIESVALLSGVARRLLAYGVPALSRVTWRPLQAAARRVRRVPQAAFARGVPLAITLVVLLFSLRAQGARGDSPLARGFTWPQTTPHAQLADRFIAMIPAGASVSAQSDLVPHLSQRRFAYLYPYHAQDADYVLLDVTGNLYPQQTRPQAYVQQVQRLLTDGGHHVVAAEDGYVLLARGPGQTLDPSDPYRLPPSFYSFATVPPAAVKHRLDVHFGSSLALVGYDVSPAPTVYIGNPALTVTTYWRVTSARPTGSYTPELALIRQDGSQAVIRDFATTEWRPVASWQPGQIYALRIWPFLVGGRELGSMRLGVRVMQTSAAGSASEPLTAAPASGVQIMEGGTLAVFATEHVAG
jgi:uncharacterized membrane protein